MHISVGKTIGSDFDLASFQYQATICTNVGLLSIVPVGTILRVISVKI